MDVLCTADMCPVILNATCVFYEGNTLLYTGITTNDNLQTALQKIDAKFGDAMVGYTFTNGVYQSAAGAPVGLGGNLIANTSIGGNFTLTFAGNVQAAKHITTGGTASQFVKGDGTLDSTAYQAAGNYITALTGDVIADGPGSVAASLAVVNSNPGTYGSGTRIPVVTVDTKGRVTALTTTAIVVPSGSLSFVGDVYGSGTTGSQTTLTLTNVNTNVYTNNTFLKFKVNAKGLVTGAAPVTHVDIEGVLGYVPVPETRTLSINGVTHDLQSNISWTIATGVSGVTASAPLVSSGGANPNISIPKADATTDGYLDNVDWVTFNSKQAALNGTGLVRMSGTTVTYDNTAYTPQSRTLTINGTTYDLSADRSWTITSMIYPDAGIAVSTGTAWGTSIVDNSTNWNTAYTERISSSSSPLSILNHVISIAQATGSADGYLSATDWNTFNNKQPAGSYVTTSRTISTTGPLQGGGDLSADRTLSITQAGASTDGYLSSTDWNTFNNKQAAGDYITALTGEATATGPGSVAITLSTPAVTGKLLTGVNITGGSVVATDTILEAFGKVQNQINGLVGGSIYKGVWNASTNTPTLTSGVGTTGWYYIVNVPGTTNLDGITDWHLGDWAIFDGTAWQQVDNTDAVVSVNGYTGAVSLVSSDIPEGLTNLYYTPARARTAISLTTTGTSGAATYDNITGILNVPIYNPDLSGYVPTTRTLTINGTTYDLSANRTWTVSGTMPAGGTAGQILSKIDATDYNTQWIDNFASQVKNQVKLGAALTKGTPVYVSSADGTNIIVSASSNATEATSSKTFGLLETGGALNAQVECVTYGLIAGLDTSAANAAGDPVWLGPNGTLLYGLANKPVAPAHMVYIGVVTRKQSNNGEIFVNIQNGFELNELHDVLITAPPTDGQGLFLQTVDGTQLWRNRTIADVLGYTPMPTITFQTPLHIVSGGQVRIYQSGASQDGYLSSTDWTTFNDKLSPLTAALTYLALAGGTLTGALSGTTFSFSSSSNSAWAGLVENSGTTDAHGLYVNIGASSTGIPFRVDKNGSALFNIANSGAATFANTVNATTFVGALTGNASTASAVAWSGVTGKPTTLSGYGITDAVKAIQGIDTPMTTLGDWIAMSTTSGITTNWVHVLNMSWVNSQDNWVSQLAFGVQDGTGAYYRTTSGAITSASWVRLLDASNYGSYALPLSGGTMTGSLTVSGIANSVIAQNNGTTAIWRGRILSKNSTADVASFLGTYGSIAGVFAHNNALDAWADLYVNNVDGSNGGKVYLPTNSYVASNVILHAANYNSYAPKLDGTGATGTWAISVSGNAATATSADNIDGWSFVNTGSNSGTNADNIGSNGISYVSGAINLLGQTDGALYSQAYSSAWQHQIYGDYRTGQIVVRGKNNGTWQAWRTIIDSSSIGSQSVTYATNSTRLYASDAPYTYTGTSPYYLYMNYDGGSYWELKVSPATPGTVRVAYANTAATATNSTQLNGISSTQIFNNMGNNHTTYSDFNSVGNFGVRYVQGGTNAPQSGQFYGFTLGLGNDYSINQYGSQFYWMRNTSTPYVWVRYLENGSWGSWNKISAGYADSAGSVAWTNVSGRPTALSSFTNDLGNYGGWITASGNTSGYAGYLPTAYAGGQQTNPQVYFSQGTGLKVAMTGAWSVWSDTLWINGYGGGDVLQMCALHTLRNGTPRMAISVQASNSTSYGTFHEFLTGYNYTSFTGGLSTSNTWTAVNYFLTNNGGSAVNNSSSAALQAYSTGNNSAFMSFHKGGYYAINMGLDGDNVFRIGGWSAGANRLQLDMSGNLTVAGSMYGSYFYGSGSIRCGDMWGGAGLYRPSGPMVFGTEANNWVFSSQAVTKVEISAGGIITAQGKVQGEYIYSLGWVYSNQNAGWYNDTYGQGLRQSKGNSTYGNVINVGENYNGYAGYVITHNYNTTYMQNSSGDHGFYQENGNGWTFFHHRGYNCAGIGTDATDPSYSLHIIKYGGSNTGWIIWSDRRIKENIKTIDNALDKVLSLRGVYYNKIDDPNKERCVGYIAQEVMEVVPELVVYSEELDIYNMNYAPMVAMLTEAIKEQQAQIEAQKSDIEILKQQVQLLLNR